MIPNEPVQIQGCQHVLCKNCVCIVLVRERKQSLVIRVTHPLLWPGEQKLGQSPHSLYP